MSPFVSMTGSGIVRTIISEPLTQTATGVRYAGSKLLISLRLFAACDGRWQMESEPQCGSGFYARVPVNLPELLNLINGVAVQ